MVRGRLPIGLQTFRKIREGNCYYVDKTLFALRLIEDGECYFLSRPRRFGKSLFLDTLKELFAGSRELFQGLKVYEHWDWSVSYPVIKLSFGRGDFLEPGYLHINLMAQFDAIEEGSGVPRRYDTAPERFNHLIRTLHRHSGQRVVVLVDEYDKPILDALRDEDVARANRNHLRGMHSTIKDCDAAVTGRPRGPRAARGPPGWSEWRRRDVVSASRHWEQLATILSSLPILGQRQAVPALRWHPLRAARSFDAPALRSPDGRGPAPGFAVRAFRSPGHPAPAA